MSEYTKIETARSIICDMCECLYPDGYCPEKCDLEKCDWMEHLKEDAADVAPVRHGRWVDNHCTACGMMPMGDEMWKNHGFEPPLFDRFMDYCPNCGCRMDGGDDE